MIYALDSGPVRTRSDGTPHFTWAKVDPRNPNDVSGSEDMNLLVKSVVIDMKAGNSIALGFHTPLFVAIPQNADRLSEGRVGESGGMSGKAPGLTSAILGINQAAWVLRYIREHHSAGVYFTIDWMQWPPEPRRQMIFCWEALVTGHVHSDAHVRDAATACTAFLASEKRLNQVNAVTAELPLSLIAAAALWSGWETDVRALAKPALVIKPTRRFGGIVRAAA
jgi:hypothetical protein